MIRNVLLSLTVVACFACCSAQFVDDMQQLESECIGEDKFPCLSGGCILQSQYCDGFVNCDDGTDEDFCFDHKANAEFCKETHQFLCEDSKRCIPSIWVCNNHTDCEDGSDEGNCISMQVAKNSTCKGFQCGDGNCISSLWTCDGLYDCEDRSDELSLDLCRNALLPHAIKDGVYCQEFPSQEERSYRCLDSSYCLPASMMCDGMKDCRDGSDEGAFCGNWHSMCDHYACENNETQCSPDRSGPTCLCLASLTLRQYNYITKKCDDINECLMERPQCSHKCVNRDGHFTCECAPGYIKDNYAYLCYASGHEAMLFFSTRHDIRYLKIKSKQMVTVASGLKEAHGVSFDGTYVYWVETSQGHEAIFKAQLDDIQDTKQVLVGIGLEDPGDIAIDHLGGNIYLSDSERGIISVCRVDGSICTTLRTDTRHPRFVTLDPRNGKMYWADYHSRAVIMSAQMDGSRAEVLVDGMSSFATGLAIDAPNERLYYVDKTIKVVMIKGKHVYSLFEEPFHRPYSISVFENTVFWSDWTSNTLQTTDKLHSSSQKRNVLLTLDSPILGMHMYHPVLSNTSSNPCANNNCSHLCLVTSDRSHVCACPDHMEMKDLTCHLPIDYHAKYLVVAGGQLFTRIQYDSLGNPENHATTFDIARVQAMAYDYVRDTLYIYDGQRRTINYINMSDFTLGVTRTLLYTDLINVLDMDYDYATDNLYILDAGRRLIEAVSLRTQKRALIYKFSKEEEPISFCVMSNYGRMLVAVVEADLHNSIHIDSIGLDGEERRHVIMNNLRGPHIRLRYVPAMDNVYIADESNGVIDYIHPEGSGRENYRELSTTITSLAIADNYVFWTDRKTSRLFWADIHETTPKIRRIDLALFPNNTQLLIQATFPIPEQKDPLLTHPCLKNVCSDICVQHPHIPYGTIMGYKCLCPPRQLVKNGRCFKLVECREDQVLCHKSNMCVLERNWCDGNKDCPDGEDEEGCPEEPMDFICLPDEIYCNGRCVERGKSECDSGNHLNNVVSPNCDITEHECANSSICIARSQLCDGRRDCPGGEDELHSHCDTPACFPTEFMCTSGSCILDTWVCDGDKDCNDGSDEADCEELVCKAGYYQCRNRACVELVRRCDGRQDCFDFSDEEDCDEPLILDITEVAPRCAPWEYSCEHNRSICLPHTARCNMKTDCPGGTDEHKCDYHCSPSGMFACEQQILCLPLHRVCNGRSDCVDGSDETPDACAKVNKTSHLYPVLVMEECAEGYLCRSGQCLEWRQVCDRHKDCFDGSDEDGLCASACQNHTCTFQCQPSPTKPVCVCPAGYHLAQDLVTCLDTDECSHEVCSQGCLNIPGSFICTCHHGYALRSDRRSCKAIRGNMSILYVSGNSVRSLTTDGLGTIEYNDKTVHAITDMDYNVGSSKLYVTSAEAGKLIEVNSTKDEITVTNVGTPTKVAVEWVTGNVYFVDVTRGGTRIRVCHVRRNRCATLQKLPSDATVSALIVDPGSRRMFYCVTRELESVIWSATLSGSKVSDLSTVRNCTGLAVDSFNKKLYVAETGPAHIIRMDYEGESHKKILADHPQLQAPHGLAIFEDHIYYLVANSFHLSRCQMFGPKHCETFVYRVFDANTFVLRHPSVQRNDLENHCEGFVCANVCALDEEGAVCVCDDGRVAKDGQCPSVDKSELPLFNGWTYLEASSSHHISLSLVGAVLVLAALYLLVFLYYHFVYRPHKARTCAYTEVRFQNAVPENLPLHYNPTVEMTTTGSGIEHEFVNPLQFVRDMWYSSMRKRTRPEMSPASPYSPQLDLSDTESNLDDREVHRILKK